MKNADIKSTKWLIFVCFSILYAFFSLHAYPFWHVNASIVHIVSGVFVLLFFSLYRTIFRISFQNIKVCVLFLLAFLYRIDGNLNAFIFSFLVVLPILSIIFLKDCYRVYLLNSFQIVLSYIIAFSSIGWLLYLFNLSLYHFMDYYGFQDNNYHYIFDNYLFFVVNRSSDGESFRFPCIFLEPGYFSLVLVFLLYINNFDFSTLKNKIYLLGLFLSFSLAGYLLFFFSFFAYNLIERKRRMIYRLLFLLGILSFSYYFASSYNNGNNIVNDKIITRLTWDEDKNNISGYNRTSESFDFEFDNFLKSDRIWFGLGSSGFSSANVGYKPYLLNYGLIGFSLLVLSMFSIYYYKKDAKNIILFLLFFFTFARGHHVVFYYGFWLIYCCGISENWLEKNYKIVEKI